jgi:hypothetical protein
MNRAKSAGYKPYPSFLRKCRAVREKFCAGKKWRIATSAFVLAGLDPAIHAFDASDEDVDTRDKPAQDDFAVSRTECKHGMPEAGTSPDSPARKQESRAASSCAGHPWTPLPAGVTRTLAGRSYTRPDTQ